MAAGASVKKSRNFGPSEQNWNFTTVFVKDVMFIHDAKARLPRNKVAVRLVLL